MSRIWAALFPEEFLEEAREELKNKGLAAEEFGRLFLFRGPFRELGWASVHWPEAREISFSSISDGARQLKPLARSWHFLSQGNHRRGTLILENLRPAGGKPFSFPPEPQIKGGVFTLLDQNRLLAATGFDRPHPEGRMEFQEDKSAPSRAYLKLWEALSLAGRIPQKGERCLDLGASPGGWTWVLARLGARVLSVDRSPLEKALMENPLVEFRSGDAFQFLPEKTGDLDWLVSDVICYPEKLFEFISAWVSSGRARNMICTIKFQGKADPAWIEKFQRLGKVLHLHHNKHELTWMRMDRK